MPLENDYVFEDSNDAMDRLRKEYDLLYIVLIEALEELRRMTEWNQKKVNDLSGRLESLKKAKERTYYIKEE